MCHIFGQSKCNISFLYRLLVHTHHDIFLLNFVLIHELNIKIRKNTGTTLLNSNLVLYGEAIVYPIVMPNKRKLCS